MENPTLGGCPVLLAEEVAGRDSDIGTQFRLGVRIVRLQPHRSLKAPVRRPASVECHDPEEFAAAMAALTSVEKVRLRKAQQIFARPPLVEGADLLHELYARVFEGTRHWRIGEDVLGFAIGAMRSLADEATKKGRREQVTASPGSRHAGEPVVTELGLANRAGVVGDVHRSVTPEDKLIAADEGRLIAAYRQEALKALADDETAQLLLEGMLEGIKGRELQDLTGLDDTAFATKQKLVKRRLERLGRDAEAHRRSA